MRYTAEVNAFAMAISMGPKEPLDYSVFSASAAARLLALHADRRPQPVTDRAGIE